MKAKIFIYLFIVSSLVMFGCTKAADSMEMEKNKESSEFEKMCTNAGYEWMLMKPTQDGKFIKDAEECWGCMIEGIEHVCQKEEFQRFVTR